MPWKSLPGGETRLPKLGWYLLEGRGNTLQKQSEVELSWQTWDLLEGRRGCRLEFGAFEQQPTRIRKPFLGPHRCHSPGHEVSTGSTSNLCCFRVNVFSRHEGPECFASLPEPV